MDEVKFEITSDNVLLTEYMQVLRNQAKEAGLDDAQLMRMSLLALWQVYPDGLPQLTWQERLQPKTEHKVQTPVAPVIEQQPVGKEPEVMQGTEPAVELEKKEVEPKTEKTEPDPLMSMMSGSMDSVTFGN